MTTTEKEAVVVRENVRTKKCAATAATATTRRRRTKEGAPSALLSTRWTKRPASAHRFAALAAPATVEEEPQTNLTHPLHPPSPQPRPRRQQPRRPPCRCFFFAKANEAEGSRLDSLFALRSRRPPWPLRTAGRTEFAAGARCPSAWSRRRRRRRKRSPLRQATVAAVPAPQRKLCCGGGPGAAPSPWPAAARGGRASRSA
mmetsp:Transcript_57659/g.113545  ORF Transcript_57659/g.113545 Transcript_57659/m.113545 type:complete len:201 (-) Transcript_57659:799-1401(-)